ncbi:unannotated protein [freshwater metagenome]|uniref:Unannotated protein n=1 Tax=freshwater metagenome TaxID=449393 RepID=A0A6J6G1W6_9ZZZZ|nr:hypothetical protein [Actinomycetota bacterium]MSY82579.1 hypothetical protein [Actinomycetota bacterium]MSZ45701.1 hypothetical protein [Actinomycetota bacterium]MTA04772.1 hypothetical protein [Actinomycetota bacterium]MTA22880.1 hypothetical protein [Actinomycetota bacterium]
MLTNRFEFLRSNFKFSWTAFLLFIPVSVIAVPISLPPSSFLTLLPQSILIGLILTACVAIYLRVLLLLRIPLFWALMVLGIIRGFTFYLLFELFNLENPTSIDVRILNSMSTTFIWLSLACVAVTARRKFQRRYRSLMSQLLISSASQKGVSVSTNQEVAALLSELQSDLKLIVEEGKLETRSDAEIAQRVREMVSVALSPLSERLWLKTNSFGPKLSLTGFILRSVKPLKIPIFEFVILYFISSFFNLLSRTGPIYALTYAISATLVAALLLIIHQRVDFPSGWLNAGFLFFIAVFSGVSGLLIGRLFVDHVSIVGGGILAPVISFILTIMAALNQGLINREEVLTNLARIELREEEKNAYITDTKAASFIHHTLQSELNAIAMQLDSETSDSQKALERLEAFSKRALSDEFESFYQSPEIKLEVIRSSWAGIAEIFIDLDPRIHSDSTRAALVAQIIQEAIANSVRKGGAKRVHVLGTMSDNSIHLDVVDNGRAVASTRKGIGSAWLDRFAVNDWELSHDANGTHLGVEL